MLGDLQPTPAPPEVPATSFWTAYRRPVFLALLLAGLVVFLVWLPDGAVSELFRALFHHRLLVGLFFAFAVIAMSLVWSAGQKLDTRAFFFFNRWNYNPKWLDVAMWLITQLGNSMAAFILAGVFYFSNDRRLAVEIILSTLTLWIMVEIIKSLSDRARPFRAMEGVRLIGWKEPGRSFPSGHTSQAFFLVTILIHRFQLSPLEIIALYTIAALVGITRIYVGVHYPRDVIGGALIGSIWGILAMIIDPFLLGFTF